MEDLYIRPATVEDGALMLAFMKKLGAYQKMSDHITATEALLSERIARGEAKAIFVIHSHTPVAFMFYYVISSAFIGEAGYYIDALYIDEAYRDKGIGHKLMHYLAKEADAAGYGRIEWGCLDWNEPALHFYETFGAKGVGDMTIYRLHRPEIEAILASNDGINK